MSETVMNDILLPEEAASFLRMPSKQLLKLTKRGEIPARKVGRGDYRYSMKKIKEWFDDWKPNMFDPNKKAEEIIKAFHGKKKKRI